MTQKKPRYLDIYRRAQLMKILTLFDVAQHDHRPLRFRFKGPEAEQACAEVRLLLERGVAPSLEEVMHGMAHYDEAMLVGVRRVGAFIDRGRGHGDPNNRLIKQTRKGGSVNAGKKRRKKL